MVIKPPSLLLTIAGLGLATICSHAAVLIDEDWTGYADNSDLNGVATNATGLTGNWSVAGASAGVKAQNSGGDLITYSAGGFSFTGGYTDPGNDYQTPTLSAATASSITGTVYFRYSFSLSKVPNDQPADKDSGIALNLGSDMLGYYVTGAGDAEIFIGSSFGSGSSASFSMTSDTVYALVGELAYSGGVYTTASLWLDPISDQESDLAGLPTKILGASLGAGVTSIDTLSFSWEDRRTGSANKLGPFRMGETIDDVGIAPIPEPATIVAVLSGLVVLGVLIKRRRS